MTPAARVSAAIEVLDQILQGAPAEKALTNWARGARYAGSKDRRAVRDHVFDALRKRASCARAGGGMTGRGIMLGLLRHLDQDPAQIFTGIAHAPAPLSPVEQGYVPMPPGFEETYDWPGWLQPETEQSLGQGMSSTLTAMRERAPLWLRINPRSGSVAGIREALAAEGIEIAVDPDLQQAARVTSGVRQVIRSEPYLAGAVEIQDRASQWAVAQLPIKFGMRVLDYCAGGGGKALAIAAQTEARVYAHDISAARMKDISIRSTRAGTEIKTLAPGTAGNYAPYDLVLVDAPCSGSGTWRRTPDQKWKLTGSRLAELCTLQAEILDQVVTLVADGGFLAYATCSVFRAENEEQIDRFLEQYPGWRIVFQGCQTPTDGGDGFGLTVLTRERPI